MIAYDERPPQRLVGPALIQSLMSGAAQFQRLQKDRRDQADEEQKFRLQNVLAGAGEVDENDARKLYELGLGSRLAPVQGAVAGQRRFKILPTPQQQLSLSSAEKQLAALSRMEEQERKAEAVRKFLAQNQVSDPETMSQAYWRAGLESPSDVTLWLKQKAAEEELRARQQHDYGLGQTRFDQRKAFEEYKRSMLNPTK